ncbi:hypothetical protein CPT_Summit_023 [Stenotrophomonas phage Summit]|nr:hypothetical protein CPT_Summit_023 [Stenotrophomonas phage Summit]
MTRLHVRHGLAVGYCVPGLRGWFKMRGLDFRDFARNGIDYEEKLEHLNDALVLPMVEEAKKEQEQKSGR